MSNPTVDIDIREQLSRLTRSVGSADRSEHTRVTTTGTTPPGWVIQINNLIEYNLYSVRQVELGSAGSIPTPITSGIQAVNIGESFISAGSLPSGTYAVMWRIGDKNVFYVNP